MDEDRKELVRHLFAVCTEILEDAHEFAIAGQGVDIHTEQTASLVVELSAKFETGISLVRAIAVLKDGP